MRLNHHFQLLFLAVCTAGAGFGQTAIDLRTQSKSVDFSAASSTRPLKTGTVLPSTCTAGEMFFKTDAAAGANLYGCVATNTWTQQAGGSSGATTTPNASQSFTSQTSVTVTHNLNSVNVIVQCYDNTSRAIEFDSATVTDVNTVVVTFGAAQSGRCVVNGTGGGGSGSTGGGEANTGSNVGTAGVGVFYQKFGTDLQFRNINSGSSMVSVTNDSANREIDINIVPGSVDISTLGGSLNPSQISATNRQGTATKFQMFGGGTVSTNDCAKFDASGNIVSAGAACGSGTGGSGEANTASNAGVNGVGLYLQKIGVDLQFKNLNAASNRISVVNNAVNRQIDLDLIPANLDLSTIGGALAAAQIATASKQGNGVKVQMFGGGTYAQDDCAKFDAAGNIVSGGPCSGGSGDAISADVGVTVTQVAAGSKRVGVDTATVPTFLTGIGNIDFPSMSPNTCTDRTFSLPGAYTADAVAPGWPITIDAGLMGMMWVSANNTISVRLCNLTSGFIDPPNQNFRGTIVRSF